MHDIYPSWSVWQQWKLTKRILQIKSENKGKNYNLLEIKWEMNQNAE